MRCPDFPKEKLLHQNFFELDTKYDLIIEQTFFCAIDPSLRPAYAEKIKYLLNEGGILAGLMFNVEFPFDGPPFGGKVEHYKALFSQYFDFVEMKDCLTSIAPRLGNEVFVEIK